MKILFVGFSNSIHTARWINQINDLHEVHLFPSISIGASHPDMHDLAIYHDFYSLSENRGINLKLFGIKYLGINGNEGILIHYLKAVINFLISLIRGLLYSINKDIQVERLADLINTIRPDIIHSLEIQSAGYLVARVKKAYINEKFPPWIVSNWGSDIYHYGKDLEHARYIREVLKSCDYYMCECDRDVVLARDFGFQGQVLGVIPNAGGYNIPKNIKYCKVTPSERKQIMLKGYQGWVGRASVALEAIDSIGNILHHKKYGLILYSTAGNVEVENKATHIAKKHNIELKLIPQFTSHDEIIRLHANSRISIGLSMSDGISTSLLESMLTGSFPIQSYTACADEWVVNGYTGILVPPEDVLAVKKAILRAIDDDSLVDKAATLNLKVINERANNNAIRKQVIELYNTVMKGAML